MKYIFVCVGVVSGVGKGVVSCSVGKILKDNGYKVTIIKIDPYLNYDAGTLGPRDHGEVFVLNDGSETDLDLGNYERFLNINLTKNNTITSGKIYKEILEKERNGDYSGKTVQVIPHLTNHIQMSIEKASKIPVESNENLDKHQLCPEICIIELGGTIGDIESASFVEGLRQLKMKKGKHNFVIIGVDYVFSLNGEYKTNPIQVSYRRAR